MPTWLCVMDTEGLSVMTAWAAGKFVGDTVGAFIKKSGIADKVKHKKLMIPGYAAGILGDLEEELPGWEITVGPREAAHIPAFMEHRNRNGSTGRRTSGQAQFTVHRLRQATRDASRVTRHGF